MRFLLLWLGLAVVVAAQARAQDRYALLIANEVYGGTCSLDEDSANPPLCDLASPDGDARLVAEALIEAGFAKENIRLVRNAGRVEINRALRDFADTLAAAGPEATGFLYYSGHGASAEIGHGEGRENYIIPSGEPIRWAEDLQDYGVPISLEIERLSRTGAGALFVVIDACRNTLRPNPVGRKGSPGLKGIRAVEVPSAVFVVFATEDGFFADDDSVFASALAREIRRPGQSAVEAFANVSATVAAAKSDPRKFPVLKPHAGKRFCFVSCEVSTEELDWAFATRRGSIEAYEIYLERHPGGEYVAEAQAAIDALKGAGQTAEPNSGGLKLAKTRGDEAYYAGDFETARKEYNLACKLGVADGCASLAVMFEEAIGGAQDLGAARAAYVMACEADLPGACTRLSQFARNGWGGSQDQTEAAQLARKACTLGDQQGCVEAIRYEVLPDPDPLERGAKLCDAGSAEACLSLGEALLAESAFDPSSAALARVAYSEACNLGSEMGCAVYGALLFDGTGGPRDPARGETLVRKGCSNGIEEACAYLAINGLQP